MAQITEILSYLASSYKSLTTNSLLVHYKDF